MALTTGTALLIGSALASAGGAIGSAVNRKKAKKTKNAWYDYAEDYANTQANSTIFDSASGKALLKLQDRQYRDNLEAIENRMAAGGATMENQLAARQANNESRDKTKMQLLQYDDKNRRAWQEKGLDIAGQRAMSQAADYAQSAQDWNQWGSQLSGSLLSLGSTSLLGGAAPVVPTDINVAALPGSSANAYAAAVKEASTPQINIGGLPKPSDKPLGDLTRHAKA